MSDTKIIVNLLADSEFIQELLDEFSDNVVASLEGVEEAYCYLVDDEEMLRTLKGRSNVYYFSLSDGIIAKMKEGATSVIRPYEVSNPVGKSVLRRMLGGDSSIHIDEAMKDIILKNNSLKITDVFSAGHYCDVVSDYAFSNNFNLFGVRNFITSTITFFHYMRDADVTGFPIEMDYSQSQESFIVRMHVPSSKFYAEYIHEALQIEQHDNQFKGILRSGISNCDFLDLYYLHSSGRMVVTAVWHKQQVGECSFSCQDIQRFNKESTDSEIVTSKIKLISEVNHLAEKEIPGGVEKIGEGTFDKVVHLALFRRVVQFVQRIRASANEERPLGYETLSEYLEQFPNQEELENLSSDEKKLIVRVLSEAEKQEELNDAVSIVKGTVEENDYIQRVSGAIESTDYGEIFVIQGTKEVIQTEEAWNVKRLDVAEAVRGRLRDKRGELKSLEDVNEEILEVLIDEFEMDENTAAEMLETFSDMASDDEVAETMASSWSDIKVNLENQKLKNDMYLREKQIFKMKRLIDSMKAEIDALKIVLGESTLENPEEIKSELVNLKKECRLLSEAHAVEKAELASMLTEKEDEVSILLSKLEEMESEHTDDKVDELEQEKKQLLNKINDLESKIYSLEMTENEEPEDTGRILEFQEKIHNLETTVSDRDSELDLLKKKVKAFETEESSFDNSEGGLKSPAYDANAEINSLKESLNVSMKKTKDLENEKKALEQKIKFLQAQIDTGAVKRAKEESKESIDPASTKKLQILEKSNQKLEAFVGKMKAELGEKKTEAHKLALENKTMKNRMHQLERQVANLSKRKVS